MTKLDHRAIEVLSSDRDASTCRVVLFDFDGTLSLIRSGWIDVMVPMMVGFLIELGSGESEEDLISVVEDYVARLTGKQTIYQMIELAEQVRSRGGEPLDPLLYKHIYLDRLNTHIKDRIKGLRSGTVSPDALMVPGARPLIEALKQRDLRLYLASGTDKPHLHKEAELLQIDSYFDGCIHGALEDYKNFSKEMLIDRIIREGDFRGKDFLAIGDGYVEIENVKRVGGYAMGAATDEPTCEQVDPVKRKRLLDAGADWIVPNYNRLDELLGTLFPV